MWRPCIAAALEKQCDVYGMLFDDIDLASAHSRPWGCHADYLSRSVSSPPLRMVEHVGSLLYELMPALRLVGPALVGPAPHAIRIMPPLRSTNGETCELAD